MASVGQQLVTRGFGADAVVLDHRPFSYATSHRIEDLLVRTTTATTEVLLKTLVPSAVVPEARGVVPDFVVDPAREREVYEVCLAGASLGTATLYAAERDALLLEKVSGVPLWEVGALGAWHQAARWLGAFHAARLHELVRPEPSHLLRYDRHYYRRWSERLKGSPATSRLLGLYPGVVEELLTLPTTMIHGEFYPSNVLVSRQEERFRICPVDWEMAAVGPGLVDVAALTTGWDGATSAALGETYQDATGPHSLCDEKEFDRALDLCRLHLCVRWLGWGQAWTPPAGHGRDWLAEAVLLADRLGM